jgi:transcriptional regulator of acetoin/glycerol metabolism
VEHGVICSDAGNVDVDSLPLDIRQYSQESVMQPYEQQAQISDSEAVDASSDESRRELMAALSKAHGSKAVAAQILGIDRTTLWRRMQKYEIAG